MNQDSLLGFPIVVSNAIQPQAPTTFGTLDAYNNIHVAVAQFRGSPRGIAALKKALSTVTSESHSPLAPMLGVALVECDYYPDDVIDAVDANGRVICIYTIDSQ
jgi:hypothetical protein